MMKINFFTKYKRIKRIKLYRQLFEKFAEKYSLDFIHGDDYKCSCDRLLEKNGDFCMSISLSDGDLIFPKWMISKSLFGKYMLCYTTSTTKITDEEKIEQFLIQSRLEKKQQMINIKKLKLLKDFN